MSAPELCDSCAMSEYDRQAAGAFCAETCCPDAATCRDELELYRDGIHAERARARLLLSKRATYMRGANGWFLPDDAYEELLSGEVSDAAEEPRREEGA